MPENCQECVYSKTLKEELLEHKEITNKRFEKMEVLIKGNESENKKSFDKVGEYKTESLTALLEFKTEIKTAILTAINKINMKWLGTIGLGILLALANFLFEIVSKKP